MALQAPYKKYKRGQRIASVETDFRNGMMFSEGAVADGYVKTLVNFDFTQDGRDALKPRAGLTACEVIVPDMATEVSFSENTFFSEDVAIKDFKECFENGETYRQFIFGVPDVDYDENDNPVPLDSGTLWLVTSRKTNDEFEDIVTTAYDYCPDSASCAFINTHLSEIHGTNLVSDAKASFPIGDFLGNSYYFFDQAGEGNLQKTEFDVESDRYLFYENPDPNKSGLDPKSLMASEAVNYGYNMLDPDPYVFDDSSGGSSIFEMQGILPYDSKFESGSSPKLVMVPRANSRVWFRCNYDIPSSTNYKIVWSWKEVSGTDDWTVFSETELDWSDFDVDSITNETILPKLQADLIVPAKEIMVRCEAYKYDSGTSTYEDTVERAMTVGFDFTIDSESSVQNSEQVNYDLSTATGMISWKNRLVLWGVPEDPTVLFISDLDEPTYFPYPNNITIFDEPIIAVTELMDNLVVFTRNKAHQVSLNTDGTSWTSVVIQSNLYIEPWDKHLIQSVRNMIYFKSGNYYYMIVPKAQSTTGELTLAPITTPITDFFNHFRSNVSSIFKDCFKTLNEYGEIVEYDPTEFSSDHTADGLVTYYNFIDYESIHNFYVYKYRNRYVHFDIIYNVVDRYWKINIYEMPHFLYPLRNDATQNGLFAVSSKVRVHDSSEDQNIYKRFIQIFRFDQLIVDDSYVPFDTTLEYTTDYEDITISDEDTSLPSAMVLAITDEDIKIAKAFVRLNKLPNENLFLVGSPYYVGGFSVVALKDAIDTSLSTLKDSMIFPNRQMLDTGYRDANLFINKRYRELQLQLNNPDNSDMEFGMDFQIAGEPRNTDYLYEVSQAIDELHEDEGIVYLDATPYMYEESDSIEKINQWTIKHDLSWKVSHWKVRASVSGKGMAPRLRLFSRKGFNYQLLGINWIYREMNMR